VQIKSKKERKKKQKGKRDSKRTDRDRRTKEVFPFGWGCEVKRGKTVAQEKMGGA